MPKETRISRRHLLAGVAALAVLPLPSLAGAAPQGFHLVNGWILTTEDLLALGLPRG